MIELVPKKYRLSIEFFGSFKRPKTVFFDYYEGTLKELLEMKIKISKPEEIKGWLKGFLFYKTEKSAKFTEKLFNQLNLYQIENIVKHLLKTYGGGFFKAPKGLMKKVEAPSSSFIAFVLNNSNETIESFLKLTWPQIECLSEGIIWNLNEQTKKGKEKNKRNMRMKELNDSVNIEEEKEIIERLKKKMDSKK